MKVLDGPMNIELEDGDLRKLCDLATEVIREQGFAYRKVMAGDERIKLLKDICHHMYWDDLDERIS